jgi:hypothetical protein
MRTLLQLGGVCLILIAISEWWLGYSGPPMGSAAHFEGKWVSLSRKDTFVVEYDEKMGYVLTGLIYNREPCCTMPFDDEPEPDSTLLFVPTDGCYDIIVTNCGASLIGKQIAEDSLMMPFTGMEEKGYVRINQ